MKQIKQQTKKQAKPSEKYLGALKKRYAKASKKERSLMPHGDVPLDEFVKTTGYHRKHAAGYHRKHAAAILSERYVRKARPIRRVRAATYTREDHKAVWQVAEWFDQIGSKRLRAAMDVVLPRLCADGHLRVSAETYQHLSASVGDQSLHTGSRSQAATRAGAQAARWHQTRDIGADTHSHLCRLE